MENLQKAVKLDPGKYKKLAKSDPDFGKIRGNKQYQAFIQ
jgi:hypothetical protein